MYKYRIKYNGDGDYYSIHTRDIYADDLPWLLFLVPIIGQIVLITMYFSWTPVGSAKTLEEAKFRVSQLIISDLIKKERISKNKTIYIDDSNFKLIKEEKHNVKNQ